MSAREGLLFKQSKKSQIRLVVDLATLEFTRSLGGSLRRMLLLFTFGFWLLQLVILVGYFSGEFLEHRRRRIVGRQNLSADLVLSSPSPLSDKTLADLTTLIKPVKQTKTIDFLT